MRLIDADALEEEIRTKDIMGGLNYRAYIRNAPTVCDIEQLSATRYNNGFYDGAKGMTEKWNGRIEQIKAEIEQLYTVDTVYEGVVAVDKADVLQIIDKYRGDRE